MRLIFLILVLASSEISSNLNFMSGKYTDTINTKKSFEKLKRQFLKENQEWKVKTYENDDTVIPESFDAREQWPECADIINKIPNQSTCNADWAMAGASAINDRVCIHSNGTQKISVSPMNIVNCVTPSEGCHIGLAYTVWTWWTKYGYCSSECQEYIFPPCEHYDIIGKYPPCPSTIEDTPFCLHDCDENSTKVYVLDLMYGQDFYFVDNSETAIQLDIMNNGPVTSCFDLYDDFPDYQTGVYNVSSPENHYIKPQNVRIIGWGVEDDVPYWLVANSWGEDWGDKGYFKILRGEDFLNSESQVAGAMPKFDQSL